MPLHRFAPIMGGFQQFGLVSDAPGSIAANAPDNARQMTVLKAGDPAIETVDRTI